jgi:DNA-binding transcriptional ArsR family regulator
MDIQSAVQYLKLLANETRLKILGLLANRERSVGEVAEILKLREPTISHHLSKLSQVGLVEMRVAGTVHFYRLNGEVLQRLGQELFAPEQVVSLAGHTEADAWAAIASSSAVCSVARPSQKSLIWCRQEKPGATTRSSSAAARTAGKSTRSPHAARHLVVPLLVAERARHPAAAGIQHAELQPLHPVQHLPRGPHPHQRLLVAVAVHHRAALQPAGAPVGQVARNSSSVKLRSASAFARGSRTRSGSSSRSVRMQLGSSPTIPHRPPPRASVSISVRCSTLRVLQQPLGDHGPPAADLPRGSATS